MMEITVGKVLKARGNMMKNKANRSSDCLLTEMCKRFPWNPYMKLHIGLRKESQEDVGASGVDNSTCCISQDA